MTAPTTGTTREHRRFRLAGNDNEIVQGISRGPKFPLVTGEDDVEGHRLAGNDTEIVQGISRGPKFPLVKADEDEMTPDPQARR